MHLYNDQEEAVAKQQPAQPERRDTYEKRCTYCSGVGYHVKTNKTTGNTYTENCGPCQGKGFNVVPVGQ